MPGSCGWSIEGLRSCTQQGICAPQPARTRATPHPTQGCSTRGRPCTFQRQIPLDCPLRRALQRKEDAVPAMLCPLSTILLLSPSRNLLFLLPLEYKRGCTMQYFAPFNTMQGCSMNTLHPSCAAPCKAAQHHFCTVPFSAASILSSCTLSSRRQSTNVDSGLWTTAGYPY